MPAFVIIDIAFHDLSGKEEYQRLASDSVASFNGNFIVRGGKTQVVEGNWKPERLVIIEFSSVERANEWLNSSAYAKAKEIRLRCAETSITIAEGI